MPTRPFNLIAQTVEDVLNKGNATFSWRELVSDKPLTDSDKRAFIEFKPILDYQRAGARQGRDRRDPQGGQPISISPANTARGSG